MILLQQQGGVGKHMERIGPDEKIDIVTQEREVEYPSFKGQMLEFEGGQNLKQKMRIIATKHNFTGYAVIIKGPAAIWDKNPDFAEKILKSFAPK